MKLKLKLEGAIKVKCLAQGHIDIFFQLVSSEIRNIDLSVTGSVLFRLPAAWS
jgi:hypothetical protein